MLILRRIVALALAGLSGYALMHSSNSIPKLQKYEDKAKKAAEWSNTAEKRLWDTRYTVGAGLIAAVVSLISAVYGVFVSGSGIWAILWPLLLAGADNFAARYMDSFWADKAKVPMMDDYNDAISANLTVIHQLNYLALGWVLMGVLRLIGY